MIKVRDKNRIRVNKGLLDEREYKRQRNNTRKMIRKAQEDYYRRLFDEKLTGMKRMWNHLGAMLNPNRIKGPLMIKRLFDNSRNLLAFPLYWKKVRRKFQNKVNRLQIF